MSEEHCQNPWKEGCKSVDIELYIVYKGRKLPICRKCWKEIVEKDIQW